MRKHLILFLDTVCLQAEQTPSCAPSCVQVGSLVIVHSSTRAASLRIVFPSGRTRGSNGNQDLPIGRSGFRLVFHGPKGMISGAFRQRRSALSAAAHRVLCQRAESHFFLHLWPPRFFFLYSITFPFQPTRFKPIGSTLSDRYPLSAVIKTRVDQTLVSCASDAPPHSFHKKRPRQPSESSSGGAIQNRTGE